MHFYSGQKGLKTGIYYLRTKPVAQAQQFTIEPEKKSKGLTLTLPKSESNNSSEKFVCNKDDPDCLM